MKLAWDRYCLDLSSKTHIMGILNVTPDSFSDGGLNFDPGQAESHAVKMVEDGADIIDIGGESTRPGSDPVPVEEELRRTIPVIRTIVRRVGVPVSIDTYKAEVAERALDAGASIVNDISGMRFDPGMAAVVSRHKVPVVLMHIKGDPKVMQASPIYESLIPEITDYLVSCIRLAVSSGISEDKVIIDPGIGFGKTFDHNLEILNRLQEFTKLGRPLLVGVSRKAFIGKILGGLPAGERVDGTAAAVAAAIFKGANIVRVHDVKEMARVAKVADAIMREKVSPGS